MCKHTDSSRLHNGKALCRIQIAYYPYGDVRNNSGESQLTHYFPFQILHFGVSIPLTRFRTIVNVLEKVGRRRVTQFWTESTDDSADARKTPDICTLLEVSAKYTSEQVHVIFLMKRYDFPGAQVFSLTLSGS